MYCQQETPDLETSPHLSDSSPRGGNQTKQHWWQLNTITKKQTHLLQQTDALLTVSYLNKQSSVSQRMNQGDEQTERGSQPPALPSKQQAVITQAKRELTKWVQALDLAISWKTSAQIEAACSGSSQEHQASLWLFQLSVEAEATLLLTVLPHTYTVLLSNSTTDTTHTRLLPSPWEILYAPLQEIFGNRLLPPYTFEHSLPTLSWWTSNISQSLMQWKCKQSQALSATRPSSPTVVQNSFFLGILVHFRHVRLLLFSLINMHEDKSPYIS